MTERPEWFELAGEDKSPESPKPKRRLLKVALIAAPLILVGGAFVAAQGEGDDAPANASTLSNGSVNNSATVSSGSQQSETVAPAQNPVTKNTLPAKSKAGISDPNQSSGLANGPAANDPDHGAGLDRPKRIGDDENEGFHPEGDGEHHHRTKG